jgi:hypothetical protein
MNTKIEELIAWYSNLTPETVDKVKDLYCEQARFIDPFNDVTGHAEIANIFHHMFETTENPNFLITDVIQKDSTAWVNWIFGCILRNKTIEINGASRLDFAEDGRVSKHHDFWDSSQLLTHIPFIGTMVRRINSRLSAPDTNNKGSKR